MGAGIEHAVDVLGTFEAVNNFISANRAQTDLVIKISTAGIGAVLATMARVLGLTNDVQLAKFRWSWFLIFPLVAFTLSVVTGYLTLSATTGFRYELVTTKYADNSGAEKKITDPVAHFENQYVGTLKLAASTQLLLSIFGVLTLAIWYSGNALLFIRGASHAAASADTSAAFDDG